MKFLILGFLLSICTYFLGKEHGKEKVCMDIIDIILSSQNNDDLVKKIGKYFGDKEAF